MPTLYVENVPEDLYETLRARARENKTSISAEVLKLLTENVPTAAGLIRRRAFARAAQKIRSQNSKSAGPFASAEEMLREDRAR